MKVMDIFSWLDAKEISLEQLQQIFEEYYMGIYHGGYVVSFEAPCNIKSNICECRAELMAEGKKIAYILKNNDIIGLIGYKGE